MKIRAAINKVDLAQPNTFPEIDKVEWLSTLDFMVANEVYSKYENTEVEFNGYDDQTNLDETELLIPNGYAEDIYVHYLQSRIDFANNEIGRYNNSLSLFNTEYENFKKFFNQNHKHKQTNLKYF